MLKSACDQAPILLFLPTPTTFLIFSSVLLFSLKAVVARQARPRRRSPPLLSSLPRPVGLVSDLVSMTLRVDSWSAPRRSAAWLSDWASAPELLTSTSNPTRVTRLRNSCAVAQEGGVKQGRVGKGTYVFSLSC